MNCLSGLLYPAPNYHVPSPPPAPFEEVMLEAAGERIHAYAHWGDGTGPVLLYFHGNGENLGTMLASRLLDDFLERGISFLTLDYPGYGRSTGRPGEDRTRAAGLAGLEYIKKKYPNRPVVIGGWSLGAAVAMQTAGAAEGRYDALALLSPWATLKETAGVHGMAWLRFLLSDRYDSRAVAREARVPVLIVHGEEDTLIPASQGIALSKEFPNQNQVRLITLSGVGHNDLLGRKQTRDELSALIERAGR